jgi:hypothetical protein
VYRQTRAHVTFVTTGVLLVESLNFPPVYSVTVFLAGAVATQHSKTKFDSLRFVPFLKSVGLIVQIV